MLNDWTFYSLIAVIGLIIGSFLNVVIYRLPRMMQRSWTHECTAYLDNLKAQGNAFKSLPLPDNLPMFNLWWPVSHCPECQHKIRPWENIPLISYLCLRGRCSACQSRIPLRYPAIEFLTSLLSLIVAFHYGFSPALLAALAITWLLIALTFIDIDTQLLPDQLTFLGLWAGLLLSTQAVFVPPVDAIFGAVLGYLILWTLYWGFKLLTRKEGMGYGDFKLMAMAGAWVGWQYLPIVIFIASFTGTLWGLYAMFKRGSHKDHPLPFGPFIALGLWLTLLYGETIVSHYFMWVN
jgi:leader peptidase (prepilin peptidase) / N-methyltransferase